MGVTFSGNKAFSGPKSFRVEAKSVYQYPLTFHPQIEDDKFQAKLIIENAETGFTQTYHLRGKADRGPPVSLCAFEDRHSVFVRLSRSVICNWRVKWGRRTFPLFDCSTDRHSSPSSVRLERRITLT